MTTLTIIKTDNSVVVDGVGKPIDCSDLASNLWAVQFDGSNGHIEYNDGTENEAITDIDAFQAKIDAHTAFDDSGAPVGDERIVPDELFAAMNWSEKRSSYRGYASIGDQLDQQYWDSVNDTTIWVDGIAAVKALYPKP